MISIVTSDDVLQANQTILRKHGISLYNFGLSLNVKTNFFVLLVIHFDLNHEVLPTIKN